MIISKNVDSELQYVITSRTLHFKEPAATSRGVYTTRNVYHLFLSLDHGKTWGVGECAPLPKLSCDATPDYVYKLLDMAEVVLCSDQDREKGRMPWIVNRPFFLSQYPSIEFGLATAIAHCATSGLPCTLQEIEDESVYTRAYPASAWRLGACPFSEEGAGIPINGLIWMGSFKQMHARIEGKLAKGYRCLKLKIGALDFDSELALLSEIRSHYTPEQLELRVDANGAFPPEEAPEKLRRLAEFQLHSIEQPVRAGHWEFMAKLCKTSPLPIALDEELIGFHTRESINLLLDTIRPQYIVLKPSLVGYTGSELWMKSAQERGIGYWFTSALESNIGLNAIAHMCSRYQSVDMPQGLGTGRLFTDNTPVPLRLQADQMFFGE